MNHESGAESYVTRLSEFQTTHARDRIPFWKGTITVGISKRSQTLGSWQHRTYHTKFRLHQLINPIYYCCIYLSIYVCIFCIYVCIYVCMYVCMDVWMYGCMDVWMYGCMDVWMYGCMDGWMDGWMYACMHACMDVCIYIYTWQKILSNLIYNVFRH